MKKIDKKKIVYAGGFLLIFIVFTFRVGNFIWPVSEKISYSTFLRRIAIRTVRDVELTTDSDEVRGTDTDGHLFYVVGFSESPYSNLALIKRLKNHNVKVLLDYRELK